MGLSNSLGTRGKVAVVALALVSPLIFTACTESPTGPSTSTSATTTPNDSGDSAEIQEVKSVYEAFDPAQLTELAKKRITESSGSNPLFVTDGLIEQDSELSIPQITGANNKSLVVAYMCRSSVDTGTLWRVDFSANSEPLNTGIQSESCTANSVEMFTTRSLTPAELPEALEVTGEVELAVSIFEIEETK